MDIQPGILLELGNTDIEIKKARFSQREEKKIKFEDVEQLFKTEFKGFGLGDNKILILEIEKLTGEVMILINSRTSKLFLNYVCMEI